MNAEEFHRYSIATYDLEKAIAYASRACSCPPGTEAMQRCNHGRRCGILRAEGRDVRSVLMSEGLAVPFQCGKTSCPPTPRPWCR